MPISHITEQESQIQKLAPPCRAFCCLGSTSGRTALGPVDSPKEGPRNPGVWRVGSCHSDPWDAQKMDLTAEPDPDFDPNTIVQTQDRLSQDYEDIQTMSMKHLLCPRL